MTATTYFISIALWYLFIFAIYTVKSDSWVTKNEAVLLLGVVFGPVWPVAATAVLCIGSIPKLRKVIREKFLSKSVEETDDYCEKHDYPPGTGG